MLHSTLVLLFRYWGGYVYVVSLEGVLIRRIRRHLPTKIMYAFSVSSILTSCPDHRTSLDFTIELK